MAIRQTVVSVGALRVPVRECDPHAGFPVLLLHGFPDCAGSWDAQLEALGAAGYRAIAPAMRGYAATAIPDDGDYFVTTLVDDLTGLMDALGLARAHLVGHDWGAVVGWVAIAAQPARFVSFSSLAIPPLGGLLAAARRYPGQARKSWYMAFFQLRGVADFVVARNDYAFVERLWRDWSPGWGWPPAAMAAVKETFRQPGVSRAALGYYRHLFRWFAPQNRRGRALAARPVTVPVLLLHGRNDGCMDARLPPAALAAGRHEAGARLELVEQAGHFLQLEQPQRVNALLLDFLAGHPG
jgi:pimeloyl-ACP methyl ester carboxylesterase